jgi:tRNA wybutosine-synthesizing protein 3
MDFDHEKKQYVDFLYDEDHTDKSRKGSLDEPIIPLLKTLNSHRDYFTTSSCAGRIIFFGESTSGKRHEAVWLYSTHDQLSAEEMARAKTLMAESKDEIFFRQEALILHVCCRTLICAQDLVDLAKSCGLKRSGIIATRQRFMVELLSTERVETPIARDGQLLVSDEYLEELRLLANKRLMRTRQKMEQLEEELRALSVKDVSVEY